MGWLSDVWNAITGAAENAWDWLTGIITMKSTKS